MCVRAMALAFVFALAQTAFATSPRVFVASNGIDTGTCSRSAPCRNFAFAVTQVSTGGEVVALDTAGYGPVTIQRAMSIYAAPGAFAFIATPAGTPGITIDAGAGSKVSLRNLVINSAGGETGIAFNSGEVLSIAKTRITGFNFTGQIGPGTALSFLPSTNDVTVRIYLDEVEVFDCLLGLWVFDLGTNSKILLSLRHSAFEGNESNALIQGASNPGSVSGVISDTTFTGATNVGFELASYNAASTAVFDVEHCTFTGNYAGVRCGYGAGQAKVRLAYCTITQNNQGLDLGTNGTIQGRTDGANNATNTLEDNSVGNTMPATYAAK